MELVARTKMFKTQGHVEEARPYNESLVQLMRRLAGRGAGEDFQSPLLQERSVRRILFISFAADRGLCGSYNNNVLKRTEREINETSASVETRLMVVGSKAQEFFRWREFDIYDAFLDIGEEAEPQIAEDIARNAMRQFSTGGVDEVRLVYTRFESIFSHPVEVMKLLPIADLDEESAKKVQGQYIYEPDPERILERLIPRYIINSIYKVLTEAKASEHAARVTAMKNATDNAGEIIDELTRQYNRARQSVITREITEIAGGAEALAQQRQQ